MTRVADIRLDIRTALPGMRQELGKPAPLHLRRLFLSSGSFLRLRRCARPIYARADRPAPAQHVALLRAAAAPARLSAHGAGGFTPLLEAPRLAKQLGAKHLYLKNDAVCLPTLSFKDRVVAVALAQARSFGFDTVSCSSTGNLANSVAAQAARNGFKAVIFIPADLEPAKILGTQVFGAKLVRIAGSYDQVNRLCSQIADERRWGFVNVNLRPYYAEGSKTVGFEIAEQLGWRLPDNVVCPMAGGSLIIKIKKAFDELVQLGLVEAKPVKYLRSAGYRMLADFDCSEGRKRGHRTAKADDHRTVAGNRQSRGRTLRDQDHHESGGWSEDVSDPEVVESIQLLAETEGVFTETAGGVTVGYGAQALRVKDGSRPTKPPCSASPATA